MNQSKDLDDKDASISNKVSNFLITRKYPTSKDLEMDAEPVCSVMEMVVEKAIENESGHHNILSFSSTSKDAMAYFQQLEEQFAALKTFIAGTIQAYKQELLGLKYPIFVNIYLELIEKGQERKALVFYNQHVGDFVSEHKEELQHLRGITGPEKLSTSDTAAHFRKSKFVYKLSHKVFMYLMQFLSGGNRSLLLHYIDKNIHLDVNNVRLSLTQADLDGNCNLKDENESITNQESADDGQSNGVSVELIESINALKEEPPCLPSVIFHKVSNCHQGFASAAVSKDGQLMCGGFEDSTVRLWSLTPKKLAVNKESFTELSQVNLGIDVNGKADTQKTSISSEMLTLRGHSGPVYGVCFSQDNSFILSASEDTSVRLWSMNSYTNRVSYIGHNYPVWHVELSSLDVYFVSSSMDQTARLWNLQYNYPLRIFAGHTSSVDTAKFHPNCSYIATASSDHTCRLWDVHSGQFVRLFSGQKGPIFSLAFTPDGKYLLGAGEDRTVYIWDIASGKHLHSLSSHSHTIYNLTVNSCNLLVSAGSAGQIFVWDLNIILKTSGENNTCSKPLQSYSTECTNILYSNFKNDNLLYAVGY